MKKITGWIKAHYDKLIAVVVLLGLLASALYLAGMIGNIQNMQARFDREIRSVVPDYPEAAPVDSAAFDAGISSIETPFRIPEWTNAMFVAEDRVRCVDCLRPIPFSATTCPFCNTEQPLEEEETEDYDGDADGLWDSWERKYGLDPTDPDDAMRDTDGDGFSNMEEFDSDPRTSPIDVKEYPPVEAKIRVLKVAADPFNLRFKGVVRLPDGTLKFQLNLRGAARTFFVRMNEDVEGFKVIRYDPKEEEQEVQGVGKRKVDVSVLVLQRGDKQIPLQFGKDVQYSEYTAKILFALDNSEYTVKIDVELTLKDRKYRVIKIDSREESVVIERLHDRKTFTIRKMRDAGESGN